MSIIANRLGGYALLLFLDAREDSSSSSESRIALLAFVFELTGGSTAGLDGFTSSSESTIGGTPDFRFVPLYIIATSEPSTQL